jgi:hypothetical protein
MCECRSLNAECGTDAAMGASVSEAVPLLVTKQADGAFAVERWPERLRISPALLAVEPLVQTVITIRASGQVRHYQVVDFSLMGDLIAVDRGGSDAIGG